MSLHDWKLDSVADFIFDNLLIWEARCCHMKPSESAAVDLRIQCPIHFPLSMKSFRKCHTFPGFLRSQWSVRLSKNVVRFCHRSFAIPLISELPERKNTFRNQANLNTILWDKCRFKIYCTGSIQYNFVMHKRWRYVCYLIMIRVR